MRRDRLRPAADPLLAKFHYTVNRHDHTRWPDHVARVDACVAEGRKMQAAAVWPWRIADLSCGDAAIPRALKRADDVLILGDLSPGYPVEGPVEETIGWISGVDLFVCCETIEHLDDPDALLARIHGKSPRLLLSTPLAEWGSPNDEHYWAWDQEAVDQMLDDAGWSDRSCTVLDHPLARYQIWSCT